MKKLLLLVLAFSYILFLYNCSDDKDDIINQNPVTNTITKDIGMEGGSIELGDLRISISEGTFDSENELKISELEDYDTGFDLVVSKSYNIEGLPQETAKPIAITLKHNGALVDKSFIAVGEEILVKSLNKEEMTYRLVDATDSLGYMIGEIPIIEADNGLRPSDKSDQRGDEKLAFNILAVSGYGSYKSPAGHFKINFPAVYVEKAYDLSDYLEEAYTKVQGLGFEYNKRSNWPVEVTVKGLKSSVYGYSTNSLWGDNYGYLELNTAKLSDAAEMKITCGHEFFHLIQSLYDSRNRFSKAKFASPNLWLDEAASVWIEPLFSSNTDYVSPIFASNARSVIEGAKASSLDPQSYGYGMAAYLKYLVDKNGQNTIVSIYNGIANGKEAFVAINSSISSSISLTWNDFIKEFLGFDLYNGGAYSPGWLIGNAAGTFNIASAADTVKKFKLKYPDLSAKIFYLKTTYTGYSEETEVTFETTNGNSNNQILLYKFNTNKCQYISQGHDTLILKGIKNILKDGYKIAVVVTNDKHDTPYTSEQELELKITIQEKFTFDYMNFSIKGSGTFQDITSDTTQIVTSSANLGLIYDPLVYGQNVNQNGKYISVNSSFTGPGGWKHSYSMNLTLDNEYYPTMVKTFSGTYTLSYTDSNTSRVHTTSASGFDVPLESSQENFTSFRIFNNIDSHISSFEFNSNDYFGVYTPPITAQRTLLEFDGSNGRIEFLFYKNE